MTTDNLVAEPPKALPAPEPQTEGEFFFGDDAREWTSFGIVGVNPDDFTELRNFEPTRVGVAGPDFSEFIELESRQFYPTSVTLQPTVSTVKAGERVSFQTMIDYGDGRGPLNRTLNYPIFESTFDLDQDIWSTTDPGDETVTVFFKKTSAERGGPILLRSISWPALEALSDLLPEGFVDDLLIEIE